MKATQRLLSARHLDDARVVLVNGARQCGKSTLVAKIGRHWPVFLAVPISALRETAAP